MHPAEISGKRVHLRICRTIITEYGMVFVLLALMVVFSLLTIREQKPTGIDAGREVADSISVRFGPEVRVFVAAPGSAEDRAFAEAIQELADSGTLKLVGTVTGSPAEARQTLERLVAENAAPDVIAVTGASAEWKIFEKFSFIRQDSIVAPTAGRWPDFLKRSNLIGVANQTAIYAVIAVGMTMVIISGGIDLSVGSVVALSSVISTVLIRDWFGGLNAAPLQVFLACLIAVSIGALAGILNGILITRADLPSFIVTLAMMLIARGLAMRLSNFQSINVVPPSFRWLGGGLWLGLPIPVLLMFLFYAAAHVLMDRTTFGRKLYAIGGNPEAARLCGIQVQRIRTIVYAICGGLAGLGGILVSSRLSAGDPKYGDMYELQVIAAVVVGGTSLMGGEGRMLGTLIGAFVIAVISNGMNLMSVEASSQKIVLGAVLLLSVLADRVKRSQLGTG